MERNWRAGCRIFGQRRWSDVRLVRWLLALILVLMPACTHIGTEMPTPASTTPEIYQQAPLQEFLLAAYNPPYA